MQESIESHHVPISETSGSSLIDLENGSSKHVTIKSEEELRAEVLGSPASTEEMNAKRSGRTSTASNAGATSKFKGSIESLWNAHSDDPDEQPSWVANYEKKKCKAAALVPPLQWVPPYIRTNLGKASEEDKMMQGGLRYSLTGDAIAGLTVGVMLVPQCLAFALLAGLPVQIGLYSSFAPLVVYSIFGTMRQVQPGPTALVSLLTGQALDSLGFESDADRIAGAALCAFLVGAISVFLGAIRFGFIVDFMSHSVMVAFCSAAGVTIGTSQLKHLLGIKMDRKKYWWQTASYLVLHLNEVDPPTFAMGGTLLLALLTLKKWKSAGGEDKRKKSRIWRWFPTNKKSCTFRALKMVADLSSILSVVVGWLWAFVYRQTDVTGVALVGEVDSDGFTFTMPDFDGAESLLVTASIIAVVGFLETVAVGGKFAMQGRYEYDPNQELLALGFANLSSALMSGYPGTGSFSRTAVNAMLGATSLFATFISSILVALAVLFLLPVIEYLPLASLAPIIIQGALGVIDSHGFVVAMRASKSEFFVMLATLLTSLGLTVKEGLLVGFILSVLKTMYDLANPNLVICGRLPDNTFRDVRNFPNAEIVPKAVVVRMDARLGFANSRKMKEFCARAVKVREDMGEEILYVVIDAKSINHIDLTGCEMLEMLAESLKSRKQGLIVANLKGPASRCLMNAEVPKSLRKQGGHLCIDMEQALAIVRGEDKDGLKSVEDMKQLVKRVQTAEIRINQTNKAKTFICSTPNIRNMGGVLAVCTDGVRSHAQNPMSPRLPVRENSTGSIPPEATVNGPLVLKLNKEPALPLEFFPSDQSNGAPTQESDGLVQEPPESRQKNGVPENHLDVEPDSDAGPKVSI
jgi:SulP family sulfate permease